MDPPGRPEPTAGGGFITFLYVAIGAAVLALALIFVGLGVLASDPRSEHWLDSAGRFLRATYQGQFTPAARALREAGCQQAFVLSAADAQAFVDAIGASDEAGLGESPFVQCRMILPSGDESCARMARVAAEASDPTPASLIVNVDGLGACNGLYAPDGTLIQGLEHDEQETSTGWEE
jgi:hypothetical protein